MDIAYLLGRLRRIGVFGYLSIPCDRGHLEGNWMAVEEANLQFLPYMDCFPLKFNRSQIKTTFSDKSDFQSSHIFVRFSDSNRISVNLNKKFKSTLLYQLCPVFYKDSVFPLRGTVHGHTPSAPSFTSLSYQGSHCSSVRLLPLTPSLCTFLQAQSLPNIFCKVRHPSEAWLSWSQLLVKNELLTQGKKHVMFD